MSDHEPFSFQEAWRSESEPIPVMNPEQLRKRASRMQSGVRWRNIGESIAAALVIAANLYYLMHFRTVLLRTGSVLIIAGVLYAMIHLLRKGSARTVPPPVFDSCVNFLLSELRRQQDLQRTVWNWYLLPLLPGLTVFILGLQNLRVPGYSRILSQLTILHTTAACVVLFALVAFTNNRASRRSQREIDAIESLRKGFGERSADENDGDSRS